MGRGVVGVWFVGWVAGVGAGLSGPMAEAYGGAYAWSKLCCIWGVATRKAQRNCVCALFCNMYITYMLHRRWMHRSCFEQKGAKWRRTDKRANAAQQQTDIYSQYALYEQAKSAKGIWHAGT